VRGRIIILAALLALLAWGTGQASVRGKHAGLSLPARLHLAFGNVGTVSATPGTISFQANNPDSGAVSGSSPGSLTWTVVSGSHLQSWTLTVQSQSSSFTGCPTIPVSAVRVSCGSAGVTGTAGTGVCGGSFPLSTTAHQIAGGAQADGTGMHTVSMNFSLSESWRYVASSACTISLTYSVNAP
jgi:hypothetical protein